MIITGLCLFLDQITKIWVRARFSPGESLDLLGSYLKITHVINRHAIFGLPLPMEYIFFPAAALSMAFILYYLIRHNPLPVLFLIGLGLIAGGALGNVMDRLLYHQVTDFIDMGLSAQWRWYVYNLADSFLLVGILLVLIEDFKKK